MRGAVVGGWVWSVTFVAALAFAGSTAHAGAVEVKLGDSLWVLAKRHGVSVESIKQANGLKTDDIRAGQTLNIPGGKTGKPEAASSSKPPAKKSDTPSTARSKTAQPETTASTASKSKTTESTAAQSTATKSTKATSSGQAKSAAQRKGVDKATAAAKRVAAKSAKSVTKRSATPSSHEPSKRVDGVTPPETRGKVFTTVSKEDREAAERLYADDKTVPPSTLEEIAPAWVLQRPGPSTQGEKSNAARGGVYPCVAPDPGMGKYEKWVQVAPMAHVLLPSDLKLDADGSFDVLFHFHGREPIRKEWVRSMERGVLVAIDVGIDSGAYATAFSDPRTFGQVLRAVEAHVGGKGYTGAAVGRVALSSWSAGYGAIEQILDQPLGLRVVDSVILLDGLHSGYEGHSLDVKRLAPFVRFAESAAKGERLLFVSHSSILTTGYASTTETAQYLVWKVGGKVRPTEPLAADPMGLERMSSYSRGGFHVRGFKGSGAADHCAHIGLMRDVLRVHLAPRWSESTESTGAVAQR